MAGAKTTPAARFADALSWQQRGDHLRADAICSELLGIEPRHADAWHLRGLLAFQMGQFERSAAFIDGSLRINPNQPAAQANLGSALLQLKRVADSLCHFDRALALQPDNPTTLYSRATAYVDAARYAEAIEDLRRAVSLAPRFGAAWVALGRALLAQELVAEALIAFDRALAVESADRLALHGRGDALFELARFEEALQCYDRALSLGPGTADLLNNRGNVLRELSRRSEALAAFEHALLLDPSSAEAHNNRGNTLLDLFNVADALEAYQAALAIRPRFATALDNLALTQLFMERPAQAAETYGSLVEAQPDYPMARGNLLYSRMMCCNWEDFDSGRERMIAEVVAGRPAQPFAFLSVTDSPALHLQCARNFARAQAWGRRLAQPVRASRLRDQRPLRVAYVSGDLRDHAVAWLLAGVLERHDRRNIESIGVALRAGDGSEIGRRVKGAFDRNVDASGIGDEELVRVLRELNVDIAVDLMGYTRWSRPAVFAQRAAPVQVGYLGYAGTLGLAAMDYLVADSVVIPDGAERWYEEAVVRLPHCYLPADDRRPTGPVPTRRQAGLPDSGFVFCAFTNAYKITPSMFAVWMQLLRDVGQSVLWLRGMGDAVRANLRQAAAGHGVDADRLVFAPWVTSMAEHLGRHALADLYLDTAPYNAHSTVCDALWAGVPVLTLAGDGFASRVAASALVTMGLPDLVTHSIEDYSASAIELALNPTRLSAQRACVMRARLTSPLFQTQQYASHLEAAYRQMADRNHAGLPPAGFKVAR